MNRLLFAGVAALAVTGASFAQQAAPSQVPLSAPSDRPFIVRLQRTTLDHDVCALVRGDGLFHLERETASSLETFEGMLDGPNLADLKAALNQKDLVALGQPKIPAPLVTNQRDILRVSILRSSLTQNLTFVDRESRRPFDSFIDPLIHWIDALQKYPHTNLPESDRNRCMPPKKLTQGEPTPAKQTVEAESPPRAVRPDGDTSASGAVPPKDNFFLRWASNYFAQGRVEETCVVVDASRRYRMERNTQDNRGKVNAHAFEDSLSDGEFQQLRDLLEEPRLKTSVHQNSASGKDFPEGQLFTLAVMRGDHVQQLSFANYFGIPFWVSRVNSETDPEEKILEPLRKWLKVHVESKKVPELKDGAATHCMGEAQGVHP